MQKTFSRCPGFRSFNIYYFMGIDGISFPLVLLTSFVSMLSMAASWPITKHVKAYCILFLLLETGMLGVFLALDFFLFYVFWEVMLLPMYFLIGVWGGPRREYAAIKFFLYTLLGSVLMLIAILMLYFASDLQRTVRRPVGGRAMSPDVDERRRAGKSCDQPGPAAHVQYSGPAARSASTTIQPFDRRSCCWGKSAAVVGVRAAVHRLRRSKCRPCRCTPGCPTRTSRPPRRSR